MHEERELKGKAEGEFPFPGVRKGSTLEKVSVSQPSLQAAPQLCWICQAWISQQQALPTQPCPPCQVAQQSLCLTKVALSPCWMMNSCL